MSELMNAKSAGQNFRWQLLTTASAAALLAAVYGTGKSEAADQDADRPTVWIELGGQLEQMQGGQAPFAPPFVANLPNTFFSPLSVQKPLGSSFGGEGAISFEPEGSDWVLSASVRFGRLTGLKQKHQQTPNAKVPVHFTFEGKYRGGYSFYPYFREKFEDAKAQRSETHTVVDFQVGKDVGLGMFGKNGSSIFSAGVRIAQFTSKSNVNLQALPDLRYPTAPISSFQEKYAFDHFEKFHFHDYRAMLNTQQSFQGIGPSVSWNGSAPFAGDPQSGEITLDWGANAAILFGRQRVRGSHQTTNRTYLTTAGWINRGAADAGSVHPGYFGILSTNVLSKKNVAIIDRTRTLVVPNLGGMAGLSFRYSDAKVCLGYRADFFFGAMDGGIDAARKENQGFYGPFASVSVGLGG